MLKLFPQRFPQLKNVEKISFPLREIQSKKCRKAYFKGFLKFFHFSTLC